MTSPTPARFIPPLAGNYPVSSGFGSRDGTLHAGTDYAAPAGTTVRAAYAGKVVAAGFDGGWGNTVLIDHGTVNGEHVFTRYAHLLSTPAVTLGSTVTTGQTLGSVGSTGDSTGNHLHFGYYVGDAATNATAKDAKSIFGSVLAGLLPEFGIPDIPGIDIPGIGEDAGVQALIAGILERIGKAADAFTSKAKLAESVVTSITKLFLPSNLLRVAAGGLGALMLIFSLYFLGRELKA